MADIRRILFVDSSPDGGQRPRFEKWSAWAWTETALSRWTYVSAETFQSATASADALIVQWSPDTALTAESICKTAHGARASLPILITIPGPEVREAIEEFRQAHKECQVRTFAQLAEDSEVGEVLKQLGVHLLEPNDDIFRPDPKDVLCAQILREMHPKLLPLTIQKYFPGASGTAIEYLGEGWSGVPLFRLSVDGDSNDYFLKFFDDRGKFEHEYEAHLRAKGWLDPHTVGIVPVGGLGPRLSAQLEAFPQRALRQPAGGPGAPYRTLYPICYESASNYASPRETLKTLYRTKGDSFVWEAYREVLNILGRGNHGSAPVHTTPIADSGKRNFFRDDGRTSVVLHALDDLRRYGLHLSSNATWEKDPRTPWPDREARIRALLLDAYPAWLKRNCPVARGHIHGDPNSRNCLVSPGDPSNVRIIDCGDYREDGLLVFDLAQLECDIKLVLMGTEADHPGFGDIDSSQIPEWCRVESHALGEGLDFDPDSADRLGTGNKSILRAYRLIGMVRKKAKQVSVEDTKGIHYFACTLYWNLKWLRLPAVRRAKKVLALYSASEILRRFDS